MAGNSVDNRVVEMTFNNAEFERKMADTMKSLDGLKKSLDFSNSKKNIDDLSSSANKFNLHGLSSGIETVSAKFLALSTIAVTTLATITNHAVTAGMQLVKSLSLDQVLGGFKEYETNINSIQTILANTSSKGSTLEDVNKALDQLNQYSDKTIYNFSQMARNIGTFTAAGIDLGTSVNAIKGIANIAAISGSNAEQASSAMYQLSQALANGTVKLMDWNSVVNAGMGGEVFQKALFDTGKAMGTLVGVPVGQTFQEWKDAGNSFRGSLETGWLTSGVLTNTLQAFTGDLTEAQLTAMGYTQEQAQEMMRLGKLGNDAATEVKTLTQLIGTIKEAIGSGWSASFRTIFGDFEQAKGLFTGLSNTIGGFVKANADARNKVLQDWANLGGRANLIAGITNIFKALGSVIAPIKKAFHNIFPPITGEILAKITETFRKFTEGLTIGIVTGRKIRAIFEGLFSIFQIGWEILKQGVDLFASLFGTLGSAVGSPILDFFVRLSVAAKSLRDYLVDSGRISYFFTVLEAAIRHPLVFLQELKDKIVDFFSGKSLSIGGVDVPFGRLQQRFESIKEFIGKVIDGLRWLKNALQPVVDLFERAFDAIKNWFKDLGDRLAEAMQPGDFNKVFDALNTIFLGGILAILVKFFKSGLKLDLGGGLFKNIDKAFGQLTSTLSAMQTEIKANALLKIAIAIGILAAAVLVLSLIDSKALTKALTAMTVGFGQLVGSMQLLNGMNKNLTGASSMTVIAAGMIAMATAVLILAGATKLLSTIDTADMARGLTAITVLLGELVLASRLMAGNAIGMITGSVGMIAMAIALNILALAVLQFANMSWEEMAKGLIGVSVGLAAMVIALKQMPKLSSLPNSAALILVAVALNILALAVKQFATMSWGELAKGFVAVGVGLIVIGKAMGRMPLSMSVTAEGLVLVAAAMWILAKAMQEFAKLSWGEIGKGLVAMAGSLLVLAVALHFMEGAIPGAIAVGIAAVALMLMARVVKEFAKLEWNDLLRGLAGIAIVLGTLALAALALEPAIPAMLALGAALFLIGAGFALFGVGASLVAKAIEILAKAGKKGIELFMTLIDKLIEKLPELGKALGLALLEMGTTLAEGAGPLIVAMGVLLGKILDTIIEQAPKLAEALIALILGLIDVLRTTIPEWIQLGIDIILAFLQGIRDNIQEVVILAIQIVEQFIEGITKELPKVVQDIVDAIVTFFLAVSKGVGEISATIMFGMAAAFISGFRKGLDDQFPGLTTWFTSLPGKIVGWIGNVATTLKQKGIDIISGLFKGLAQRIEGVINWFLGLAARAVKAIPNPLDILFQVGKDIMNGLWEGMKNIWHKVTGWLSNLNPANWFNDINPYKGHAIKNLYETGQMVMDGFHTGLKEGWGEVNDWLRTLDPVDSMTSNMSKIVAAVGDQLGDVENLQPTITPILDLTDIKAKASQIGAMLDNGAVTPTVSLSNAKRLSLDTLAAANDAATTEANTPPRDVQFIQNNYSPTQLNAALLYKQNRNQIELAKRELAIP